MLSTSQYPMDLYYLESNVCTNHTLKTWLPLEYNIKYKSAIYEKSKICIMIEINPKM